MTPVTEATPAIKLTERINRIEPSATMAVVAEADKLRQQGIDVVDFGAGEPHFSTPQHVKDAAISAIQNSFAPSVSRKVSRLACDSQSTISPRNWNNVTSPMAITIVQTAISSSQGAAGLV